MSETIKYLRIERGLKISDLATLIGVSKATYSKKENGIVKFSLEEAKIISDKFKLTIEEIFFNN